MPLYKGPRPSFKATLSANQTNIADNTNTKLAFDTEAFDIGGYYDAATNYRWTPPAGRVRLEAMAFVTGTFAADAASSLKIYKNGSLFGLSAGTYSQVANENVCSVSAVDVANGTDYYEVFVITDTSSGTVTAVDQDFRSYFAGWQL